MSKEMDDINEKIIKALEEQIESYKAIVKIHEKMGLLINKRGK